jgi:cell division protein FtsN
VALAVAVYVTKVPVPFLNKGQNRTADQDAAERKRTRTGTRTRRCMARTRCVPAPAASGAVVATPRSKRAPARRRPTPGASPGTAQEVKPAVTGDPLGDLAKAKVSRQHGVDPFIYFVQAGAYRTSRDAEAQRAKLSLMGWRPR